MGIWRYTKVNTNTNGVKKRDAHGKVLREKVWDPDGGRLDAVTGKRRGAFRTQDVYEVLPGTPREEDACMDGAMYLDILQNRGGLAAIRKYADDLREAKRAYPEQWPELHSESESDSVAQ